MKSFTFLELRVPSVISEEYLLIWETLIGLKLGIVRLWLAIDIVVPEELCIIRMRLNLVIRVVCIF
jgi:hypothetical protein